MNKFKWFRNAPPAVALALLASLAAILLAGCSITIGGGGGGSNPFTDAPSYTATEDRVGDGGASTPVASEVNVRDGEPNYFVIDVPSDRTDPLLYIEAYDAAEAPLTVDVFASPSGAPVLRSDDRTTFSDASAAASAGATSELSPQQITVRRSCEGPCVIVPADAGQVYVRVSTSSESTVDYSLYAYDAAYNEASEPSNDRCADTTAVVGDGGSYSGALETLGDRDCIQVTGNDTDVDLNWVGSSPLIEVRFTVTDSFGETEVRTLSSDGVTSATVSMADPIVRVQVDGDPDYAGPPTGSAYSIFF